MKNKFILERLSENVSVRDAPWFTFWKGGKFEKYKTI